MLRAPALSRGSDAALRRCLQGSIVMARRNSRMHLSARKAAALTLCHPLTQGSGCSASGHGPAVPHRRWSASAWDAAATRRCPPIRRAGCAASCAARPVATATRGRARPRPRGAARGPGRTSRHPGESRVRALYRAEAAAALENALTTPAPFRERLVWFWTNHFTVSIRGGVCRGCRRLRRGGDPARTSPAGSRTCCSPSCATRRC